MSENARIYHLSDIGDARHATVERMLSNALDDVRADSDAAAVKAALVIYWRLPDGGRVTTVRGAGVNYLEALGLLHDGADALCRDGEDED